jgi:hypothetical protein
VRSFWSETANGTYVDSSNIIKCLVLISINRRAFSRKTFVDERLKLPSTAANSPALKCCRGFYPGHKIHFNNLDFIPSNRIFVQYPKNPHHKCIRINRACVTWCSLVRSYRIFGENWHFFLRVIRIRKVKASFFSSTLICVCIYIYIYIIYIYTHTHTYIYICLCVCVYIYTHTHTLNYTVLQIIMPWLR